MLTGIYMNINLEDTIKQPGDQSQDLQNLQVDLELIEEDENRHTAFIWQGFDHFWLRSFLGAKLPHRIQYISNFLSHEQHNSDQGISNAKFTIGQKNVVEGNFMRPKSFYKVIKSEALLFHSGSISLNWTDEIVDDEFPNAKSPIRMEIPFPEIKEKLANSEYPKHTVLINGFQLNTTKNDTFQDQKVPHGFWPYRIYFGLSRIKVQDDIPYLPVIVDIFRAWTPKKGGLPPLDQRPVSKSLNFSFNLYFTIIQGNENIDISQRQVQMTGSAKESGPKQKLIELPSYQNTSPSHVTGFSGFGFEFFPVLDNNNQGHLARYIGGVRFQLVDQKNKNESEIVSQIWVPKTVVNTGVTYQLSVDTLTIPQDMIKSTETKVVETCICINSDETAKFYSNWNRCGQGKHCESRSENVINVIETLD